MTVKAFSKKARGFAVSVRLALIRRRRRSYVLNFSRAPTLRLEFTVLSTKSRCLGVCAKVGDNLGHDADLGPIVRPGAEI